VADKELVKRLRKGVEDWNKWRATNRDTRIDLSGADLRHANLAGANLHDADLRLANLNEVNLRGANLGWAHFDGTDLRWADLSGSDLSGAHLRGVHLSDVDLSRSDLCWANLSWADLRGVQLREANLSGAVIGGTSFVEVDLSQTRGLKDVKHFGPSYISIDTLYRSKGKIPLEFLRGAGVPDNFIEYMHSLVGTGFEFYSCFISYSTKDEEFADRLYADLQNKGVRCWFAPHDAKGGQKLDLQIDQAIRLHEKVLLILSPDSIKSDWVRREIKKAAKRQAQENKDVLFPVSLVPFKKLQQWEYWDGDLAKDLAAEIREYLIPDFSNWKNHDAYKKAFDKLLKDLQSGKTKA
jgi:uncharacterized protein YjbI with pentapeptide repeats